MLACEGVRDCGRTGVGAVDSAVALMPMVRTHGWGGQDTSYMYVDVGWVLDAYGCFHAKPAMQELGIVTL